MNTELRALVSRLMKETPYLMRALREPYDGTGFHGSLLEKGPVGALNDLVTNRGYDPHLIQDRMNEWDDMYGDLISSSESAIGALGDTLASVKASDGGPITWPLAIGTEEHTGFPSIDFRHPGWAENVENLPPAMRSATALAPDSDEVSELFALLDKNKRRREQDMPY